MGAASDYLENKVLDHVFKVAEYTPPTNIYVALCKSTIDDADTGSTLPGEVTGGGYERTLCNDWAPASGAQLYNENRVVFPKATATWGTISNIALCDAQTGGNVLTYGRLYDYKEVITDDHVEFEAGGLVVTLDEVLGVAVYVRGRVEATSSAIGALDFVGDEVHASSPELADVQAAINAASPGDTVRVPAGSATWTSQLVITRGIQLIAAGIGQTVITNGWVSTGANDSLIYYWPSQTACENNDPFRLSGFEINGNGATSRFFTVRQERILPYITNIRVDHNKFYNCSRGNWFSIMGHVAGVGDNNLIGTAEHDHYQSNKTFHSGRNANTWLYETFQYGSAQQFYWEDNTYYVHGQSGCCMGYYGAKYAFRYNTIHYGYTTGFWLFDMHGNKGGAGMTGTMGVELYENQIVCANNLGGTLVDHRGGMLLCYNNRHNRTANAPSINLREENHDNEAPPHSSPDGQPQHIARSYYFNNTNVSGVNGGVGNSQQLDYSNPSVPGYLAELAWKGLVSQEDRDWFKQNDSFNGSSGVGIGLRSARPASCTTEEVGYWATDESILYRWKDGAWEAYYTPYTYPHPLRGE